jgi:hypothetical protein
MFFSRMYEKVVSVAANPRIRIRYMWVRVFTCVYIYIYSLYIKSPGLPITRENPGRTVQSGRAGLDPDVYKTGPGVLGFSFLRSTPIH